MVVLNSILPKLVLALMFFGYAAWVSGSFIVDASLYRRDLPLAVSSVIDGDFTAKLETIYKDRLPYRPMSADLIGAARYVVFGEGRKGVVVGKDGWLFSSEEYRSSTSDMKNVADAAHLVATIRDRLAAQGTDLLVIPLPAKAEIYREHTNDPSLTEAMGQRYSAFAQALDTEGVRNIDARTALLEAKKSDQVFLKGDTHWSPWGAATVAQATASAIGVLGDPTPFEITEVETRPVAGDLTKFIVSAKYAPYVNLAPELVTLVRASAKPSEQATGLDIFGGPAVGLALVGTSYSANEQWGFAASLMKASHSDVVNFAEEGHGPFAPMWKYLKSDLATNTPPKLVVWEIPVRYLTDPAILATMAGEKE